MPSRLILIAIAILTAEAPAVPRLYIVGDSTAANGQDLGWGSHLGEFFDPAKIAVINRACGGRSSRTFRTDGLWAEVVRELRAGDHLLIQFGHNDGGTPGEAKDRGSLPGLGQQTVEIDGELVHTFGWYLRRYIAEARAKGAQPIVLSLTVRNEWRDGKVERGPGSFSRWSEDVATSENATFVDLNNIIGATYERMGTEAVSAFFPRDHTHTSPAGAKLNARLVVAGLKALPGQPFDNALSELGEIVEPDAAGKPQPFPTPGQLAAGHNPALPTVFFIGDSTVKNGRDVGSDGLWGWGHPVASRFDRSRINVENEALGGTSSRTYRTAGHWAKVLDLIGAGDFVVMQFGHNDASPINDDKRARGTIPGNADESQEITNLMTGEPETVHSYGWYLRQYIAEARAKGAIPIVCSPVPRNNWQGDRIRRDENPYPATAREVAVQTGAHFVDLNSLIADHYDAIGEAAVAAYFPSDHTHTGWAGALKNAAIFAGGLRQLGESCGLSGYLRPTQLPSGAKRDD